MCVKPHVHVKMSSFPPIFCSIKDGSNWNQAFTPDHYPCEGYPIFFPQYLPCVSHTKAFSPLFYVRAPASTGSDSLSDT